VTTRVPQLLAADAVVTNEVGTRTLVVRLSELAGGYARLLWRQAHLQLVAAEESGFRTGAPPVWAHGAGQREIAHGLPGDNATRTFRFAPRVEAYGELSANRACPRLSRSTGRLGRSWA
jgi:hypothetical protein